MATDAANSEKLKREQRAAWDENAAGWKKWWPTFERAAQTVSDRLVALAAIKPGHRVLDVATGTGEPAVTAARIVGTSGRVVAVDQSPAMLAIGRERAASLGLNNLEFVEADAESLALPPASFDAIVCRWGFMFMPDLDTTVAALRKLLKPGGRLATAVWASGEKVPMITLAADAIRKLTGAPPPPPGTLDPMRLADTSLLRRPLEASGFRAIAEQRLNVRFEFASEEVFAEFRSEVGRGREMMAKLGPDVREKARIAMSEAVRKFTLGDGSVRLDNETILISASL